LQPAREKFPHLKFPPFFCDLEITNADKPELRIDGFVGENLVLSKSFSSDTAQDQFFLQTDNTELLNDGIDATRLFFGVTDKFDAPRAFAGGRVSFQIEGAATIVGDNPFQLADAGGLAAVWLNPIQNSSGRVTIIGTHSILGTKSVKINLRSNARAVSI
jgi:beta-galactosidase